MYVYPKKLQNLGLIKLIQYKTNKKTIYKDIWDKLWKTYIAKEASEVKLASLYYIIDNLIKFI